jgi:hypothetical protein
LKEQTEKIYPGVSCLQPSWQVGLIDAKKTAVSYARTVKTLVIYHGFLIDASWFGNPHFSRKVVDDGKS